MRLVVDDGKAGISEDAWSRSARLARLRRVPWAGDEGRVVIVVPHPDDETLALGGTLYGLAASGRQITVVAITDGEGSHPRSTTTSAEALSARRAAERKAAFDHLGLASARVVALHVPDGSVTADRDLTNPLVACLRGASLCFAPWRADGHPDHDASGRAAASACALTGVPLFEYPVWAWHWARPESRDLPWPRLRRIPLSPAARRAKDRAIDAYGSQVRPLSSSPGDETIVPAPVLAHFRRRFEVVIV